MSLSHFFSITQTWRIAISWLDTPGRILSSTWYHQWLQLVTPMRQNAQKRSRKFCRSKEDKNGETHPKSSEKGETGCVLGAGGGSSGWRRMRADGKGRSEQGRGGRLLLSLAKMEGRTCLACRLGRFATERHWRSLTPRHAVLEWMWEQTTRSGRGPVFPGSCRK